MLTPTKYFLSLDGRFLSNTAGKDNGINPNQINVLNSSELSIIVHHITIFSSYLPRGTEYDATYLATL